MLSLDGGENFPVTKMKILFPDENVITTKYFSVSQDWEVPIPGFFIIAPVRKLKSVTDFSEEEALEFIKLVQKVRRGMKEVLRIDEVYLFQNEDSEHGFHLWIFPRYHWMEKFGRKIESVRPIMNYAKKNMTGERVWKEVREYVDRLKKFLMDV